MRHRPFLQAEVLADLVTAEFVTWSFHSSPAFGHCSSPGGEKAVTWKPVRQSCEEEGARRHCWSSAQVLTGGPCTALPLTSGKLAFSHRQGGGWKGQGEEKGSGVRGKPQFQGGHRMCQPICLPLRKCS